MKLILAIIQENDEYETTGNLTKNGFFITKLATTGGFLKEKNVTLMICTEDDNVEKAISCIKTTAKTRKTVSYSLPYTGSFMLNPGIPPLVPQSVEVGGCTLFVLPVEQYLKF